MAPAKSQAPIKRAQVSQNISTSETLAGSVLGVGGAATAVV